MKTVVTFLFAVFLITMGYAAPSIVINAGSIICVNEASFTINNGDLVINNPDGFLSDNTSTVNSGTPTVFEGPEGTSDALTITSSALMGTVQIINYSGQRHPNATTSKISRWWNMSIPTTSTSTIVFGVRVSNDCLGYDLTKLSPYELSGSNWIKMSNAVPSVTTNGQFSDISFSGVAFTAKKGTHIVTLGLSSDQELPVELSSFTAVSATSQLLVTLQWTTESETNNLGFNILRSNDDDISHSMYVNSGIIQGTNTSTQQTYQFADHNVEGLRTYFYWLENVDFNGFNGFAGPVMVQILEQDDPNTPPIIPLVTKLCNAYPNPFNPQTIIAYDLKAASDVIIQIYNVNGQHIKTLVDTNHDAGHYTIVWNGTNDKGNPCGSGIYFYRMNAGKYNKTQKVVLMK